MGILQKLYQRTVEAATEQPEAVDPEFQAEYPSIWEFISVVELDHVARQPGKLQITTEDGKIKVTLVDQQLKALVSHTGDSFSTTMAAFEHQLSNGNVEWYFWDKKRPTRGGRVKARSDRNGASAVAGSK